MKVRSYGLSAQKYENLTLDPNVTKQIIVNQQSALFTLYHCLEALLKLFSNNQAAANCDLHPFG